MFPTWLRFYNYRLTHHRAIFSPIHQAVAFSHSYQISFVTFPVFHDKLIFFKFKITAEVNGINPWARPKTHLNVVTLRQERRV